MKVLVYGTGSMARKFIPAIGLLYEIIAFVETTNKNALNSFLGKTLLSVDEIGSLDYDLIIICSSFDTTINQELEQRSISKFASVQEMNNVLETFYLLQQENAQARSSLINSINPPSLNAKHIANTKLLVSREHLIQELKTGSVGAELGVNKGEFSQLLLQTVKPAKLHLIDIWGSDRYNENLYESVNTKFSGIISSGQVEIHRKLSTEAIADFDDGYFDWVYIDTDHSYQTTFDELTGYAPKIKRGGMLMGHDYCMGNWVSQYKYGVMEAVHRFCVEFDFEIIFLTMELTQSFSLRKIQG